MELFDSTENIVAFIDTLAMKDGQSMMEYTERHFKDEFSTYDWVMDGLMTRAVSRLWVKTLIEVCSEPACRQELRTQT